MIKSICRNCEYGHNYYKKPLPKNEAWCFKYCSKQKNKRNCPDFVPKDDSWINVENL